MSNELHDQIMNIKCRRADDSFLNAASRLLYKEGHRDARHAAAELAIGYVASPVASAAPSGEREKFEAAMKKSAAGLYCFNFNTYSNHPQIMDGVYESSEVRTAWDMWQAALAHQPPKEAQIHQQIPISPRNSHDQ